MEATILDSVTEGVFTVDSEWRITSFNRAAERITGIPRERPIGQPCRDIFRADVCESQCTLKQTIETGSPVDGRTIKILDAHGDQAHQHLDSGSARPQRRCLWRCGNVSGPDNNRATAKADRARLVL